MCFLCLLTDTRIFFLISIFVGVERNQTAAKALFETALELEAPSTTSEYTEHEMLLEEGDGGAFGDFYAEDVAIDGAGGAVLGGGGGAEHVLGPAGNCLSFKTLNTHNLVTHLCRLSVSCPLLQATRQRRCGRVCKSSHGSATSTLAAGRPLGLLLPPPKGSRRLSHWLWCRQTPSCSELASIRPLES